MENPRYASTGAQRFLVWLAIVLPAIYGFAYVGLIRFFPPPPAYLSASEVSALYTEHNLRFRVGVILGLLSGGFLLPFSLVVSIQMARLEKGLPIWACLQAMAGALGSIILWLPALIWGVAAFTPERPPEVTLIFHEFALLCFITPFGLFPFQALGIIVLCFTKAEEDRVSAFPRWMGYLTTWNAVQGFGGPIAILFKRGIFAWNGLIPMWLPFSLFSIWYAAMCWTLLRALRHQRAVTI